MCINRSIISDAPVTSNNFIVEAFLWTPFVWLSLYHNIVFHKLVLCVMLAGHGDTICGHTGTTILVYSISNDRLCMDNNQAFVVLLYNVLHTAVLCLPWNGGCITDPQQSSGYYIVFNVLHYSKPHGWLHSAWSRKLIYHYSSIPITWLLLHNYALVQKMKATFEDWYPGVHVQALMVYCIKFLHITSNKNNLLPRGKY